jgi:opacity protein-like surface antigen
VRPEAWVEQSRYHDGMGPERVQVTASRTDLIARPTDNAQVVGMSRRGESLNVVRVSRDNRWYLVELGGGEVAWISSQAVRAIGVPPNTTRDVIVRPPDAPPPRAVAVAPTAPSVARAPFREEPPPPREEPPPPREEPPPPRVAAIDEEPPPSPKEKKRKSKKERMAVAQIELPPSESARAASDPGEPPSGEVEKEVPPAAHGGVWAAARGGMAFLGQRFTSNSTGYLTNYETSSSGLDVDLELGYRYALGRWVYLGIDGDYRFAGITGFAVKAPGATVVLGEQVHDIDAGATAGAHFDVLGGLTVSLHLGLRMMLELVGQDAKAPLPSDRMTTMATAIRLEAPKIFAGLGARIDAEIMAPGSIAQTVGLGDGDAQGVFGWSLDGELFYKVWKGVAIDATYRFSTIGAHFEGAASARTKATSADRSTTVQAVAIGVSWAQ